MREVLKVLSKTEKRNDKDTEKILPLLRVREFFKTIRPMNDSELLEIS